MSGIHNLAMLKIQSALQTALIDNIPATDKARAGVIALGPLQGDPDPDTARISVSIFENDPDAVLGKEGSAETLRWIDTIYDIEVGGCITWQRRFCIKARCLLENTGEDLLTANDIASTVRSRIEQALLSCKFTNVLADSGEYVSRGVFASSLRGDMLQSGGPGAYDFHIKVRFELLTTISIGV